MRCFIIVLLVLNGFVFSQTWERIYSDDTFGVVQDIVCGDEGILYIACSSGLLRSTNHGKSWSSIYISTGVDKRVQCFYLLDYSRYLMSINFGLHYSSDKGATWNRIEGIQTDFVLEDQCGNLYAGNIPVYKSSDRGETWKVFLDDIFVSAMYFVKNGNILAGTDCGIFLSTDNGSEWERTGYFNCGDITVIKGTKDDEKIYILGADRYNGIRYSSDYGKEWQLVEGSDTIYNVISAVMVKNELYMGSVTQGVQKFNLADNSIESYNAGLSKWIISMSLDSVGYLYAGGVGLYRTMESVDTSLYNRGQQDTISISEKMINRIEQNYPNPFKSTTIIEFTTQNRQMVTIKVYNLLGEKICTLLNEVKAPGKHKIKFSGTGLSSGIYYYRIECGSWGSTKKFVFLK